MRLRTWSSVLFLLLLALTITSVAFAQDGTPREPTDDEVNAIAKQMYCPVCENIPLDVCPTQACAEWRELIRDKLVEGWTEEQIKDYFVEQFGDRVLAEPPRRGLNWLAYAIPPIAFLAGVFILYRVFRTWRTSTPEAMTQMPANEMGIPSLEDDEYVKRLEKELRER